MSKSVAQELEDVYSALFQDAKKAYPHLSTDFERDEIRVRDAVQQRGLYALCVDLPAADDCLVQALNSGKYKPSGLPLTRKVGGGVVIPRLFRGLYLLVFHGDGRLKDRKDIDTNALWFLRQFLRLAKKAVVVCADEHILAAKAAYISTDDELPPVHPFWSEPSYHDEDLSGVFHGFAAEPHYLERALSLSGDDGEFSSVVDVLSTLDTVSGVLCSTLGRFRPEEWKNCHGPGVVSNLDKRRLSKYSWTNWSERLEAVFPLADWGYPNHAMWANDTDTRERNSWVTRHCSLTPREQKMDHESHWLVPVSTEESVSKLTGVPKKFLSPRFIEIGSSENMWCQQCVWSYFRTKTERTWIGDLIAFGDQGLNQMLCVQASLDGTLVTVDLSAASDRVSCLAVGCFFRHSRRLLRALAATRSRYVDVSLTDDGLLGDHEVMELKKFAGMGNACTFPVESMFFLGIAVSSTLVARKLQATEANIRSLIGEVCVFGDDIIVPTESKNLLYRTLAVLDCKVNEQKSHTTGLFRESCGVDAFDGYDITPVYWKAPYEKGSAESYAQAVDTINNWTVVGCHSVAEYLRRTVTDINIPRVAWNSQYVGMRTPGMTGVPKYEKYRYNRDLQRGEFLLPVLVTKQSKRKPDGHACLLEFFNKEYDPFLKRKSWIVTRAEARVGFKWVPQESLTADQAAT